MKYLIVIFFCFLNFSFIVAQESKTRDLISSAGALTNGKGHILTYSIGDINTTYLTKDQTVLLLGYLQPEISIIKENSIQIGNINNGSIKIYPNPASNKINIEIDWDQKTESIITLSDLLGREVRKIVLSRDNNKTQINRLESGQYFIRISSNNNLIYTSLIEVY